MPRNIDPSGGIVKAQRVKISSPLVTAAARALHDYAFNNGKSQYAAWLHVPESLKDGYRRQARAVIGVVLDEIATHIEAQRPDDRSSPHIRIGYVMATRDALAMLAELRGDA